MAKKSKENDGLTFDEIAERTGGEIQGNLSPIKGFVDTGNLAFNYACCGKFITGGIPRGRITEIFGPSSSGKSLFAANIIHGCQQIGGWPILLDVENASNNEFMETVSRIDLKRLLRFGAERVPTLEKVFLTIHNVTRGIRELEKKKGMESKPIVFIYDSIAGSPCERELRETNLPTDYKASDWKKIVGRKESPGERAKICSGAFRKLTPIIAENDVSVVILNQIRDKIGVMFGNPETTGGGGKSLEFYASLRLRMQSKKKIENKELETFAGINLSVRNTKNRTFRPYIQSDDIKLYFEEGVDPLSGLLRCLMQDQRIKLASKGKWQVMPDYLPEGTTEYTFRARLSDNTVPEKALLDCPSLVDAESTEEVEKYLSEFRAGLNATISGGFSEKTVSVNVDGELIESDEEDENSESFEDLQEEDLQEEDLQEED